MVPNALVLLPLRGRVRVLFPQSGLCVCLTNRSWQEFLAPGLKILPNSSPRLFGVPALRVHPARQEEVDAAYREASMGGVVSPAVHLAEFPASLSTSSHREAEPPGKSPRRQLNQPATLPGAEMSLPG